MATTAYGERERERESLRERELNVQKLGLTN